MPRDKRLVIPSGPAVDAVLEALAAAPWWPELEYFEVAFWDLAGKPGWSKLWSGPTLALREARLRFPHTQDAIDVVRGDLPQLRVLALVGEIKAEFLDDLTWAHLPSLEDLEIRQTNLRLEDVRRFALADKPGLKSLKRLGISFASDRRVDYTDWNGAVVDWGYEPLTTAELEYEVLRGSGLTVMPEIYGWPD